MKNPIHLIICLCPIFWALTSCNYLGSGRSLAIFKDIDPEKYESDIAEMPLSDYTPREVVVPENTINTTLLFSTLFDTVTMVRLSNEDASLIGTVDKILFGDSSIYILDRYKTKSIKKFTLDGNYLMDIGKYGEGPEEYFQPTDFFISDNEIIVYDQFKSDLKFFDPNGHFKRHKRMPFMFLQFARFSPNHYVFQTVNADNDHLKSIVNYSIFASDSSFVLTNRGFYRPKDLYNSFISNNFYPFGDKIFYHPDFNDTIFSIGADSRINAEYVFKFKGIKQLPEKLQRQENRSDYNRAEEAGSYVLFNNIFAVSDNYLYFSYSIAHALCQGVYSSKTGKVIAGHILRNDINSLFQFLGILTSVKDDVLVGYSQADYIYNYFKEFSRDTWVKEFGEDFTKKIEVIKEDDNPVLLFFKIKDF